MIIISKYGCGIPGIGRKVHTAFGSMDLLGRNCTQKTSFPDAVLAQYATITEYDLGAFLPISGIPVTLIQKGTYI